jgi:hypothetical protein
MQAQERESMCEREVHASTGERDRDEWDRSSETFLGGESRADPWGIWRQKTEPQHIRKQYPYEAHVNCKLDPHSAICNETKLTST